MFLQTHLRSRHGSYSYLLASIDAGEAILIDPSAEAARSWPSLLGTLGCELRYTLETGSVPEAARFADELCERYDGSPIAPARSARGRGAIPVAGGDVLRLAGMDVRVIGRPELSDRRLCYLFADRAFTGSLCLRAEPQLLDLPPETLVYRSCEVRGSHFGLLALEAGPAVAERQRWRSGPGAALQRRLSEWRHEGAAGRALRGAQAEGRRAALPTHSRVP